MARKKLLTPKTDYDYYRMMEDKVRQANIELKPKLRKPLSNPDGQRLLKIFIGDGIYKSIFDREGKMHFSKKNKKGSVFDNLFISFWFFFAAVALIIIILVWNNLFAGITWSSTTGQTVANIFDARIKPQYDYMVMGLYFGAILVTLILAFLIRLHRLFIIITFIFSVATYLVSAVLSNVFEKMIASGELATAALDFPITVFIIDKFPLFYVFFSIVIIFVMAISEQIG